MKLFLDTAQQFRADWESAQQDGEGREDSEGGALMHPAHGSPDA